MLPGHRGRASGRSSRWSSAPPTRRSSRSSGSQPTESTKERPYIQRNITATRAAFNLADTESEDFAADLDLDAGRPRDERRHHPQRPPVGPADPRGDRPAAAEDPELLPVQRRRRRPLRDRRPADPGAALGPRAEHPGHPVAVVGQPAPGVHPRLRRRSSRRAAAWRRTATRSSASRTCRRCRRWGRPRSSSRPSTSARTCPATPSSTPTSRRSTTPTPTAPTTPPSTPARRASRWTRSCARAALALRFGDINPLISSLITTESRAVYLRDIDERVRKAAPFLRFDADPYLVIHQGRILWLQDAYTTTTRYPYSRRADTVRLRRRQRAQRRLQLRAQLGEGRHRRLRRHA